MRRTIGPSSSSRSETTVGSPVPAWREAAEPGAILMTFYGVTRLTAACSLAMCLSCAETPTRPSLPYEPLLDTPSELGWRLQSSQKTCAWERETYCRGDGSSNERVEIVAVIQDHPFDREEMRESLFARVGAEADPQINVIEWAQAYVMVQWSARPGPGAEPLRGIVLAMASWPTAMKAASGQWGVHIIGYVGTGETLGSDFWDPLCALFWTPGRRWRAVSGLSALTTRIPFPGLDHASADVAQLAGQRHQALPMPSRH